MSLNKLFFCCILSLLLLLSFNESQPHFPERVFGQWVLGKYQYVSTERGLLKLSKEGTGAYLMESWEDRVMDIALEGETLVAVTYNGVMYVLQDSVKNKVVLPLQSNGLPYVLNGIEYRNENWWISSLEGLVFEFDGEKVVRTFKLRDPKTKKPQNINAMGIDNRGHLWVSSLNRIYFLTGIHKRRKNKMAFLASSEYSFESSELYSNSNGVYVMAKDNEGMRTLSLGSLNASVMDAIKKDVRLPEALIGHEDIKVCATEDAVYVLADNTLYSLDNLTWNQRDVSSNIEDVDNIAVLNNRLWIGGSSGLKAYHLNADDSRP